MRKSLISLAALAACNQSAQASAVTLFGVVEHLHRPLLRLGPLPLPPEPANPFRPLPGPPPSAPRTSLPHLQRPEWYLPLLETDVRQPHLLQALPPVIFVDKDAPIPAGWVPLDPGLRQPMAA
jgi:hypothetical protein